MGRRLIGFILATALLLGLMPNPGFSQETVPDQARAKTVNVQIVLDSSGSMAAMTNTGEMRYQAAQNVLRDVIQAIPDQEGINVGLRVYGHLGDNTDTGRPESCQSTELLVPMSGVNRDALTAGVDSLVPVGWTPLGLSLESAGVDFTQPAGDDTVNAIVLVTDGLETCDGDPVSVAGQLKNSPAEVTTYVIGFGTTPEEQGILNGISSAGGGQLFGAENATELNAALFSILEELEIVVGAGYIGGNAFRVVPAGTPGQVSVIGFGNGNYGMFPVVARNDIGQDVSSIKVSVTIRDASGSLVANGDTGQGLSPRYVRAGGLAIGYVYLGPDFVIPDGAQIEYDISFSPATRVSPFEKLDFDIVEANLFDNRIVGTLSNGQQVAGQYGVDVVAVCFDMNGTPLSAEQTYLNETILQPGDSASFQVDIIGAYMGQQCPVFLVAGGATSPASMPAATNLVTPQPTTADTSDQQSPESATPPAGLEADASPAPNSAELDEPPYPLPTQDPALGSTYTSVNGVEDAVARAFSAPNDFGLWLQFIIADFDSPQSAQSALPVFTDRFDSRQLSDPQFPSTLERIEIPVPDGFDAVVATVYTMQGTSPTQYVSLVTATRGDRLYAIDISGYQPGFDQRTLEILSQVVLDPLSRDQAGNELTYGLWGELPLLAEVPAGYQVDPNLGDYVPRSFGPIPPN
jgi:hypothetical protein